MREDRMWSSYRNDVLELAEGLDLVRIIHFCIEDVLTVATLADSHAGMRVGYGSRKIIFSHRFGNVLEGIRRDTVASLDRGVAQCTLDV